MNGGWQYIAGFFDGEGTVRLSLNGSRHLPIIVFYQSDRKPLEAIQNFLAERGIKSTVVGVGRRGGNLKKVVSIKPQFHLVIRKWSDVERVGNEMLPYLIVKNSVVMDIIRFRKIYPALSGEQYAEVARQTRWASRGRSSDPKYEYKHRWYEANK